MSDIPDAAFTSPTITPSSSSPEFPPSRRRKNRRHIFLHFSSLLPQTQQVSPRGVLSRQYRMIWEYYGEAISCPYSQRLPVGDSFYERHGESISWVSWSPLQRFLVYQHPLPLFLLLCGSIVARILLLLFLFLLRILFVPFVSINP